ncbi:MAG: hypothetical protein JSW28_09920, partial [Thermoplasmata archaeon]
MTTENQKDLKERLGDLATFFERNRFNLVTGTLLLYSYILVRLVLEWALLREPDAPVGVGLYNIYFNTFVFTSMFVSGILVMAIVSRIKVKKIVNVVLLGFVLILLGP